jgi:hypothetical protein
MSIDTKEGRRRLAAALPELMGRVLALRDKSYPGSGYHWELMKTAGGLIFRVMDYDKRYADEQLLVDEVIFEDLTERVAKAEAPADHVTLECLDLRVTFEGDDGAAKAEVFALAAQELIRGQRVRVVVAGNSVSFEATEGDVAEDVAPVAFADCVIALLGSEAHEAALSAPRMVATVPVAGK